VRAGDYRIIYAIDDGAHTVTVATIGHRREIYRNLDL
jgi:mRNA-degrading endonuclease RelE of RelBE toxin-antitoxin system